MLSVLCPLHFSGLNAYVNGLVEKIGMNDIKSEVRGTVTDQIVTQVRN